MTQLESTSHYVWITVSHDVRQRMTIIKIIEAIFHGPLQPKPWRFYASLADDNDADIIPEL